jgi:hypothetical protein
VIVRSLAGRQLEHALLFATLLSLIITLFDRYRPVHLARDASRADVPSPASGRSEAQAPAGT